jgi:hypothetical protein
MLLVALSQLSDQVLDSLSSIPGGDMLFFFATPSRASLWVTLSLVQYFNAYLKRFRKG